MAALAISPTVFCRLLLGLGENAEFGEGVNRSSLFPKTEEEAAVIV